MSSARRPSPSKYPSGALFSRTCVHLFVLIYTLANIAQGVYANTTITLGVALDSGFFKIWGCIYAAMTLCMWLYVAWRSIGLVHTREIFEAPCLEAVDVEKLRRRGIRISYGRHMDGQGLPASAPESSGAYPEEKVPDAYRSPYSSGCSQVSLPHHSEIRLPPIDLPFPAAGAAGGEDKDVKRSPRDVRVEEAPASKRSSRVADIVSIRRTDSRHESEVWGNGVDSPKSAAPPLPLSLHGRDAHVQLSSDGTRVPSTPNEHPLYAAPHSDYVSPRAQPHYQLHSQMVSPVSHHMSPVSHPMSPVALHNSSISHPVSPHISPYELQMPPPTGPLHPAPTSPTHANPLSPTRSGVLSPRRSGERVHNWRARYRDNNPYH